MVTPPKEHASARQKVYPEDFPASTHSYLHIFGLSFDRFHATTPCKATQWGTVISPAAHHPSHQTRGLLYHWRAEVAHIVDQGLPSVSPAQEVICGVGLMRSSQAVSRPCGKLPNGKQHSAASSPVLQVRSRSAGPVDYGEQLSGASLPALLVGSRTAEPADNGEQLSAASLPALQVWSRIAGPADNGKQLSAASSPALQAGGPVTTAGNTALPLRLHCRLVLHCRISSPLVVLLHSHKLFVDPVESTCCLHRRASCTAQGFGGLLYQRDCCSEVSLKIWPPRPAPASPTPSLRGVLWRAALYVHSS